MIRPATEKDFPQLLSLFREFAGFQNSADKMVNTLDQMKEEKALFNAFVVEDASCNIIGFASWFYTYHTWVGKSIFLDDLYVKQAYRKQGLGKSLFEKVQEQGHTSGCHSMRWLVSGWNQPARDFYLSLGADIHESELTCELKL